MRLYVALIRAWTNSGGFLGASEEGPLQRFLSQVLRRLGLPLSERGVKAAIQREQGRRLGLRVKNIGFGGQSDMTTDALAINSSGMNKVK